MINETECVLSLYLFPRVVEGGGVERIKQFSISDYNQIYSEGITFMLSLVEGNHFSTNAFSLWSNS